MADNKKRNAYQRGTQGSLKIEVRRSTDRNSIFKLETVEKRSQSRGETTVSTRDHIQARIETLLTGILQRSQLSTSSGDAFLHLSPFAKKVYRAVLSIPFGEVRTYQWVARQAGNAKAVRAVGQILKRNPCPPLIPCHRVVASGGGLGGYVFGRRAKGHLLKIERQMRKSMV